ncbi:RDD family protein [Nocardiopsis mangrovi]|uniref:RDD family protein n=1 Tax=Nocardiopsis mangrovi TaxID=1179818 RepID=A0ABV9E3R7_9ACTN
MSASPGPPPAGLGPHPAGLGRRIAARLVDLVITGAAALAVTSLVIRTLPGAADPAGIQPLPAVVLSLSLFALYTGYEVIFTGLYGRTIGKWVCRVRITAAPAPETRSRAATGAGTGGAAPDPLLPGPGEAPVPVAVFKRSAVLYASVLFNFVPVLGMIALMVSAYAVVSVFTSPQRRGIHDRVGDTAVVGGPVGSVSS